MKLSTAFLCACVLFAFFSCGMRKLGGDVATIPTLSSAIESFTLRDEYPGVESDLLSVRSFALTVAWKRNAEPRAIGLALDSVLIEASEPWNGSSVANGKWRLNFSRANYRAGSTYAIEEALPSSPLGNLGEGEYVLLVELEGRIYQIALPKPEVLPSVYYP